MIINADSILPHLKTLVRPTQTDASRHLLCPHCRTRTKLNSLADGRRKCSVCRKKFRINKVTDETKLRQCSEILLCFCLDFPSRSTTQITRHRERLVAVYYDHFRRLLSPASPTSEKKAQLRIHEIAWKEHHKNLAHDLQAKKIIALMPVDFLKSWQRIAVPPERALKTT